MGKLAGISRHVHEWTEMQAGGGIAETYVALGIAQRELMRRMV